ncbi:MAG TPA: HRDC domain-containing protein [Labilithrix sp.]
MADASLVTTPVQLAAVARELAGAKRIAVDLESNGLFAYRACVCIVQIAAAGRVVLVDALATPLDALRDLLGPSGPVKVIHDVAFDARVLAEAGVVLGNAQDTALAARMLGKAATGLAALLQSELGVSIDKKMQHHDWGVRPLDAHALAYLAEDVVHLEPLADVLFGAVEERGIAQAIAEETRYRIAQAVEAAGADDPRPPWVRLKGIEKTPAAELPILRRLAALREEKARALDVPPYKVLAPDVLFAIAQAKPRTEAELGKVRGALQGRRAQSLARDVLRAVAAGLADGGVPENELAMITRPRVPANVMRARRAREQRLSKWRRDEAKKRGVDEQVVLPGHCLQECADLDEASLESLSQVRGIGTFRVERDGAALLAALRGDGS